MADGSDLVAAGAFAGTGTLGSGSVTSTGTSDGLVVSYGPTGTLEWSRRIGGAGANASLRDLARDSAGNLYVIGSFTGSVDAGGGTLVSAGMNDVIVASFTSAGAHRWSRRYGGTGQDAGFVIGADAAGNVVVAMNAFGSVDLGGGPIGGASNATLLLGLTSGGIHRFSRAFVPSATTPTYPEGVVIDAAGASYVVGQYASPTDFGGGSLTPMSNDGFAAAFDASGNHLWSRRFGGSSIDGLDAAALDSTGGLVAAGSFRGTVDFGAGPLVARGTTWDDLFVIRLDRATGSTTWARRFGDDETELASTIAVDAAGNILVGGMFAGSVDFGGGFVTATSGNFSGSPFLLGLTPAGVYRFVWVPLGDGELSGVAVSGTRALVVGGWGRNMNLGGGALTQYDSMGSSNLDAFAGVIEL